MSDDRRAAYLAGDEPAGLSAADITALDDLRDLLSDSAVWAEPPPGLGERVVESISAAATSPESSPRSRRAWLVLSVAAAVIIAAAITFGLTRGGSSPRPQHFAAKLSATALAAGASGNATLTKTDSGWRIDLDAQGLPRRDNGQYYEAWLRNAAGVLVPVGTFNQGPHVTLWAAVSPADFPTLTITQQAVGGGAASTGRVVLAGTAVRRH